MQHDMAHSSITLGSDRLKYKSYTVNKDNCNRNIHLSEVSIIPRLLSFLGYTFLHANNNSREVKVKMINACM